MKLKTIFTRMKSMLENFLACMSYKQKVALSLLCGIIVGLTGLFLYLLRIHTYIVGDDPAACINCHIMSPSYATWSHSAHARNTTCNDCHVPNNNMAAHYAFKGMDGMKHVAYFVTHSESQSIEAEKASAEVIMDNCMEAKRGEGKACWDCHRDVAHMNKNSLSSTPGAEFVEPMPPSPVPQWLQKALGRE